MTGLEGTTSSSCDVAAVTEARDLEIVPPAGGSPQNLPNEVLLIIFKPLEKKDLKAVRSVCNLFSRLVSPLLFDKIYISPHKPNLDVFRQLAGHQDLCKHPRTLIYDVQQFQDKLDLKEYYKKLCHQLHYFLGAYRKTTTIQHVDQELDGLLQMVKFNPNPAQNNSSGYKKYSTCRIVRRGLEIYTKRAEEQNHYNGGELLARLCAGLVRLIHVEKVMFQSYWGTWHLCSLDWSENPRDLHLSPSPLARIWRPFHLQPESRKHSSTVEFNNVISTFSVTGRPLRVLDGDYTPSVAHEIFYSESLLSRTFCEHRYNAMVRIEDLSLNIDTRHYPQSGSIEDFKDPKQKTVSVNSLAIALRLVPRLRSLSLYVNIYDTGNGLLSLGELFYASLFPSLEYLRLCGMLGSAAEFSAFLQSQPRLCGLSLKGIELSEGTWVDLVDDMRRRLQLGSLDLQLPLRQDGGVDIFDEENWDDSDTEEESSDDSDMSEKIKEYVLNGGENPLRAAA